MNLNELSSLKSDFPNYQNNNLHTRYDIEINVGNYKFNLNIFVLYTHHFLTHKFL